MSTQPPRDDIVSRSPGTAGGRMKRGDQLNGQPRTRSLGQRGPSFTDKANPRSSWPVPNSPYPSE